MKLVIILAVVVFLALGALKQSDSSKFYIYSADGGQDCIISCVTKENFECLKSLGLNFAPLT